MNRIYVLTTEAKFHGNMTYDNSWFEKNKGL